MAGFNLTVLSINKGSTDNIFIGIIIGGDDFDFAGRISGGIVDLTGDIVAAGVINRSCGVLYCQPRGTAGRSSGRPARSTGKLQVEFSEERRTAWRC